MKKGIKKVLICISVLGTLALSAFGIGCTNSLGDKLEQWACSHDYGDAATYIMPATCGEEGYEEWTCTKCLKVETKVLEKTGHRNTALVDAVPATCASVGYTGYKYCMDCGENLTERKEIAKLPHNYVHVEAKAADCQEEGYTEGIRCAGCGDVKSGCEPIAKLLHDKAVIIPAVAATCADGWTEGAKCSMCGILTKAPEVIPGTGIHEYVACEDVEATCSSEGRRNGERCIVCEQWNPEVGETIPKLPHTPNLNCECRVCGATAHFEVKEVEAISPTCTSSGRTAGSICNKCGKVLVASEEIPKLGHDRVESCECARCGEVIHNYNVFARCIDCGETYVTPYLKYELSSDGNSYIVTGLQLRDTDIDGTVLEEGLWNEEIYVVIPDTYNGKPVKSIAHMAFGNMDDNENGRIIIRKVYLNGCSSGLTVGRDAFGSNDFLEEIYLSGKINFEGEIVGGTSTFYGQFKNCNKLRKIVVNEGTVLNRVVSDSTKPVSEDYQIFTDSGNEVVNVYRGRVEISLIGKTFPTISKGFFGGLLSCKVIHGEDMIIPTTSDNWLPKDGNGSSDTVVVELDKPTVIDRPGGGKTFAGFEISEGKFNIVDGDYVIDWDIAVPGGAPFAADENFKVGFVILSADNYKKLGVSYDLLFGDNAAYTLYNTDLDPKSAWYITLNNDDVDVSLITSTVYGGALEYTVRMNTYSDFCVYHSGFFGNGEQDLEHPDTIRSFMDIICIPYVEWEGKYYFAYSADVEELAKSTKEFAKEYIEAHPDLSEKKVADIKDEFGLDDDENAAA